MCVGDTMKHEKLIQHLLSIDSMELMGAFLKDLATEKELQDFSDRLEVATRLLDGKTYDQIAKEIKMSSATIARVNRAIMYGEGGYKIVIERQQKK